MLFQFFDLLLLLLHGVHQGRDDGTISVGERQIFFLVRAVAGNFVVDRLRFRIVVLVETFRRDRFRDCLLEIGRVESDLLGVGPMEAVNPHAFVIPVKVDRLDGHDFCQPAAVATVNFEQRIGGRSASRY